LNGQTGRRSTDRKLERVCILKLAPILCARPKVHSMSTTPSTLPALVAALALAFATSAAPAEIGQIKVLKGQVSVERNGQTYPGSVGMRVETSDVLKTGPDGSVGVTMKDDSLLSAGPNSILSLDRYEFDPVTNNGHFDAQLKKGSLAVISGRIVKQAPDAMTIRTPSAILGVRGTEFVVSAGD
jgi:hypothetical protein